MSDFTEIMQKLSVADERIRGLQSSNDALRLAVKRVEIDRDTWKNRAYGFALAGVIAIGCLIVFAMLGLL